MAGLRPRLSLSEEPPAMMIPRLKAFLLGMFEFRTSLTTGYYDADGEPIWPLTLAYDSGRELAHKITLRRYER